MREPSEKPSEFGQVLLNAAHAHADERGWTRRGSTPVMYEVEFGSISYEVWAGHEPEGYEIMVIAPQPTTALVPHVAGVYGDDGKLVSIEDYTHLPPTYYDRASLPLGR